MIPKSATVQSDGVKRGRAVRGGGSTCTGDSSYCLRPVALGDHPQVQHQAASGKRSLEERESLRSESMIVLVVTHFLSVPVVVHHEHPALPPEKCMQLF